MNNREELRVEFLELMKTNPNSILAKDKILEFLEEMRPKDSSAIDIKYIISILNIKNSNTSEEIALNLKSIDRIPLF